MTVMSDRSRRTSARGRRGRRRRDTPPARIVALGGAAVVAGLIALALIALRSPNGLPLVRYHTYYASVPDPGNLQPHSDVRVDGVRIGQVIGIQSYSGRARIEFKVGSDAGRIPRDSAVRIRAAGLLGARYLQLVPGKSPTPLADGATIVGAAAALTYGVPDALDTFDRRTRGALSTMLGGLGVGLNGQGLLINRALEVAPQSGEDFIKVARELLRDPSALRRLVPAMETAASAFDASREELAAGISPTQRVLQQFAGRHRDVDRTLRALPPALASAEPALDEGRHLVSATRRLAGAVARQLQPAPRGLRAATKLLRGARMPLARATTLLRSVQPTVPAVLRVTGGLAPLLDPLRDAAADLHPIVETLGEHGCDIDNMTENWRSALGWGLPESAQDAPLPSGAVGNLNHFRITVVAGRESVQGFSQPPSDRSGYDVYPAPCVGSPGPEYHEPDLNGGER